METSSGLRKRKIKLSVESKQVPDEDCFLEKSFTNAKRVVGDGAPSEPETETMEQLKSDTNIEKQLPSLKIHLEIDLIFLGLLLLALGTRLYKLEEPRHIVFDELHYGRYVSLYTKGIFFFDAHPPLGKQLLYLAGSVAGYDGNFTFDRIGSPYSDNVPVRALRMVPAVAGSLLVPLSYQLMLALSVSRLTAILAALLVLFENCFLAQSRFMLLECIQLLFGLTGVLCAVTSTKRVGVAAAAWLSVAALALGCCFSVKYSGLYTYYLAIFLVGRQLWRWLGQPHPGRRLLLSAAWRLVVLTALPWAVYVGVFYVHLRVLRRAGPHDSAMSSAFQASLDGGLASITRGQPLHVAHGSQITLRHAHGRTCWLHSHAHVYPVKYADGRGSSHQQQVSCYSFKDVNNWWIVKRPARDSLAVARPADAIRHGDAVQLLHGITSRALNSHDVAACATPQAQEVSCYIDYNVSMPAQNLWRVEIVNRESDSATWDSIRSLVRLHHVGSDAALRYSGRQLPAWGFHQHEVVAERGATGEGTVWNVEEHRYTKAEDRRERERELVSAEMIPTAATRLSFWEKFCELQYRMLANSQPAPLGHMFASEPAEWPLLTRSIAYWLSPTSNAQVHLIGNLVTWYSGSAAILLHTLLLAASCVLARRAPPAARTPPAARDPAPLYLGYWLHYLPHFFMDRTLFLHHYLPAYIFKILLLAYVIEHVYRLLCSRERTRQLCSLYLVCVAVWLSYVAMTFRKFSVLNYGTTDLTESDLISLRWKDTWDFILHKRG